MQVTETNTEGLKRELLVTIGAGDIGERFNSRLAELQGTIQLKGFRKGMVPPAHIKKLYGRSLMAEVLQQAVDESSQRALGERKERPAFQPKIELPEDEAEIEKVLTGQSDLSFEMSYEVLPEFTVTDLSAIKLTRHTAEVGDSDIDEALDTLAGRNVAYESEEGRAAVDGDRLTIDFVGKIDGEPFENGTGEDVQLVLGQTGFIPGFEEGLAGSKSGEERVVNASFPENYPVEQLKGRDAQFDVKVKDVARAVKPEINEEFATSLGVENLAQLRELVSAQIKREYDQVSREKLKRSLLDELEKAHEFELPPSLVDGEFEGMWQQLTQEMERAGKTFEDEGKSEDEVRADYRKIAERRVRLGLVVGEIGEKNEIQVTQDELKRAIMDQARQFQGQEKAIFDYYEKNPGALTELRAPIFEEKVVDFILELAKPDERIVDKAELMKPDDDEAQSSS